MANAKHSESYLAVEAMFGTTPTCNLKYKVDHAEPALACSPISNHVGGKVVLVKVNSFYCECSVIAIEYCWLPLV